MDLNNKVDNVIAWFSGNILTTTTAFFTMEHLSWLEPVYKITIALAVGILGGFGGLLGKDVYGWLKSKL
jgi:hypothetical protein